MVPSRKIIAQRCVAAAADFEIQNPPPGGGGPRWRVIAQGIETPPQDVGDAVEDYPAGKYAGPGHGKVDEPVVGLSEDPCKGARRVIETHPVPAIPKAREVALSQATCSVATSFPLARARSSR